MRLAAAMILAAVTLGGCSGATPEGDDSAGAMESATPAPIAPPAPPAPDANPLPLPPRPVATESPQQSPVSPTPPSDARSEYVFPVRDCAADYGRTHHDYPAADIFAAHGCAIVSVTSGTVDEVSREDTWTSDENDGATRGGLSVSVVGDDGVRYYYSHLSSIADGVEPGAAVQAGRRLGSVGKSGSARGTPPHLHFGLSWPTPEGIWWVRRGVLEPARYLDAWKSGRALSPAGEIERLRADRGEVPACVSLC